MFSCALTILDCGASRAVAGIVGRAGGRLRLERFAVESLTPRPDNDEAWLRATAAALGALRARLKPVGRILLVMPPHLTLTKTLVTPWVSAAKRARILRFEAAQALPCSLTEVVWGTIGTGETDTEYEYWLAAAKREAVDALAAAATSAGFEPDEMLPAPLATWGAVGLALSGASEPSLVLNLGARSVTLLQIGDGRFASRTIALGAPDVASEAYAVRLTQEVTRTLLHFGRRRHAQRPTQVFLAGGGARLAGLDETLSRSLALPVRRLEPLASVVLGREVAVVGDADAAGVLGEVVGAAALWHEAPAIALNLLPMRRRRLAWLHRRRRWLMAAAALLVAALLPPIWHWRSVENAARAKTAALEAVWVPVRERAARMRTAEADREELRRQVEVLQGVQVRRTAWVGLLSDLQARLGRIEDVWLDRLQPIPPAGGAPLKLAVSGCLLDRANPLAKASPMALARVQALLVELADSPFVASVEGERFDPSRPGLLRFDFVLVTDPAHPL